MNVRLLKIAQFDLDAAYNSEREGLGYKVSLGSFLHDRPDQAISPGLAEIP